MCIAISFSYCYYTSMKPKLTFQKIRDTKDYLVIASVSDTYIIEADNITDAENEARCYLLETIKKGEIQYEDIEISSREK